MRYRGNGSPDVHRLTTLLTGLKALVGTGQALGARTIIGALQICWQSGQVPAQYLTPRLAAGWASGASVMPGGFFSMLELHARPLTPTPVGARMLVWFTGRIVGGAPFTEYWSFVLRATRQLPGALPNLRRSHGWEHVDRGLFVLPRARAAERSG